MLLMNKKGGSEQLPLFDFKDYDLHDFIEEFDSMKFGAQYVLKTVDQLSLLLTYLDNGFTVTSNVGMTAFREYVEYTLSLLQSTDIVTADYFAFFVKRDLFNPTLGYLRFSSIGLETVGTKEEVDTIIDAYKKINPYANVFSIQSTILVQVQN